MRKGVIIAAAVLLALLAAAGIVIATKQKEDSPPVRIIEDTMDNNAAKNGTSPNDEIILSQNAQIAELRAQLEDLERKMAQQEFDYTALKAEKDALERRNSDLADQNRWLRGRNNELSSSEGKLRNDVAALGTEIAALNEQLAQLEKKREENEAAYQEALARIEEYEAKVASTQAALDEANSVPGTRMTEEGELVSTFKTMPAGQSRNIIGIRAGETAWDIEGTFALMPHWFLLADAGIAEVPDNLVEEDFPGFRSDHAHMYTVLFGTGLNWRMNSLQLQPNFYIRTMLGPAWFKYKINYNDDEGINTYLLWRSSVGFDLTLYKNLQFTTDVSLDWIKDFDLKPHVTIGLQWNFSNSWALFGGK